MLPDFVRESASLGLVTAFGVVIAAFIVAGIAQVVFSILIRVRRRRGDADSLDIQILTAARGPVILFFIILGFLIGYMVITRSTDPALEFFHGRDEWAIRIWTVIVILEISYLGSHILQSLMLWYIENVAHRTATDLDAKLLPQVRRVTPIVVYAVGVLMALDVVGVSITPLVAGLGIGGLAVALALQPTLSNFFAGTYLITEGELNEGDYIELDGGPAGFVVDVGWRSTKVQDRFNNLIMIPNSKMIDSIMTNYYSPTMVMTVVVDCGVAYESDLERVESVALEVASGVRDDLDVTIKDFDPVVRFNNFGDSNIDFVVVMQANDRIGTFVTKHELIKRLHARFNQEGIEINYPVRKLMFPSTDGSDGAAQATAIVSREFDPDNPNLVPVDLQPDDDDEDQADEA